jgi:hypothetical protein
VENRGASKIKNRMAISFSYLTTIHPKETKLTPQRDIYKSSALLHYFE